MDAPHQHHAAQHLAEALGDGDPPEPWQILMAAGR
jgi:hypothetical protein